MDIRSFFQTIQWRPTLQVAAIRIVIASVLWSLFLVLFGNAKVVDFFPQIFSFLFLFSAFVAVAIVAIGLVRMNIPYVGLAALPAWVIVVADPVVKVLHTKRPDLVPVDNFKYFNPPVLGIFGVEDPKQSFDEATFASPKAKDDSKNVNDYSDSSNSGNGSFSKANSHCFKLIGAIQENDARAVQLLLQHPDTWQIENYQSAELEHPLVLATEKCGEYGVTDITRILAESKFLINKPIQNSFFPIISAIRNGNTDAINLLLDNGADLNWSRSKDGWPPALASAVQLMGRIPKDRLLNIIDLLAQRGVEVNSTEGPALHYAMCAGDRNQMRLPVLKKLIEIGANVNQVAVIPSLFYPAGSRIGTPLYSYYASGIGAVRILLDNGADLTIKNNLGESVIEFFREYKAKATEETETVDEVLSLLMQQQIVDPVARMLPRVTTDGESAERSRKRVGSALDEFVRSAIGHDVTRAIDLWRVSSKQIVEEYRRVRDDEDGSVWFDSKCALFDTLIYQGVKAGDADATRTMEALISAGVLLNEPDWGGYTPVGLLAMIGQTDLLQHAIRSGGDVNAGDENALACIFGGREPDQGWAKTADLLIKAGAHVDGSSGQTPPIFNALKRNHRDAIRFLVTHGADLNRVHYIRRSDYSGTAMHYSVLAAFSQETDPETGKLLVALGGDPTVKNKRGFGAIDAFFASDREPSDNVKALVKIYSATDIWRQSSIYLSNPGPSGYNPVRGRTLSDQSQEKLWNEIAGAEVRFRIGDKVEVIRREGFYGSRVDLTLLEGGSERLCDHEMIALAGSTGIITGWDQNHGNHWKAVIDFEPGTWEETDNYGRTRSLGRCRGSLFPDALRIVQTEEEIKKGIGA